MASELEEKLRKIHLQECGSCDLDSEYCGKDYRLCQKDIDSIISLLEPLKRVELKRPKNPYGGYRTVGLREGVRNTAERYFEEGVSSTIALNQEVQPDRPKIVCLLGST